MGIFKIDPNKSDMQKYLDIYKSNVDLDLLNIVEEVDVHIPCGLLKSYFLSHYILNETEYIKLLEASSIENEEEKLSEVTNIIKKLKEKDILTLTYLFHFFKEVVKNKDFNLMSSKSLASQWTPVIFHGNNEGEDIIETFIDHCDEIFGKFKLKQYINGIVERKFEQNTFNVNNLPLTKLTIEKIPQSIGRSHTLKRRGEMKSLFKEQTEDTHDKGDHFVIETSRELYPPSKKKKIN